MSGAIKRVGCEVPTACRATRRRLCASCARRRQIAGLPPAPMLPAVAPAYVQPDLEARPIGFVAIAADNLRRGLEARDSLYFGPAS